MQRLSRQTPPGARALQARRDKHMAPKGKKRAAPSAPASDWDAVPDAASDPAVLKAVMEVQQFWIHGDIVPGQVNGARVRQRGTGKRSKTNTDFEVDIQCGMVVYKAAIKGEGNPKLRDPVEGRIWVTQPCAVCNKDDNEELLLLCGTDDADAPVQGCERSHHTYCVGIEEVPEDDWFCSQCAAKPPASLEAEP
jgi:hypothetical protein